MTADAFNDWQRDNGEHVTVQTPAGYEEVVPHGLLPTGTVTDHGTILGRSPTAYEMADGTFVAFMTIHGPYPVAEPLVVLR